MRMGLKLSADESPIKEVVYHGSDSPIPPHELPDKRNIVGQPVRTFHAGTEDSARDRLNFWTQPGNGLGYLHKYRISDKAVGDAIWRDPIHNDDFHRDLPISELNALPEWDRSVPEDDETTVHPYTNDVEDKHSISYVIPKNMVGNQVHYLGTQFSDIFSTGRSSTQESWFQ